MNNKYTIKQTYKTTIVDIYKDMESEKLNGWMLIFQDLLSLLLTFFILLYATTEYSKGKWRDVSNVLAERFGNVNKNYFIPVRLMDVDYMYSLLKNKIDQNIARNPEISNILLTNLGDKLVISIPINIIFENNSDVTKMRSKSLIYFIASNLFDLKNTITVNVVDNISRQKTTESGYSNYNLSIKRSASVAHELKDIIKIDEIKYFVLNAEYNKLPRNDNTYLNRIEIVIDDEQREK